MRVYLPATIESLAAVLAKGEIAPSPLHGYGVTPALREAYASGDEEELEYVAMLAAAVLIGTAVPLSAVAAGHADDVSAMADIAAATLASAAADAGDEDAQFTVDGAEGHELAWYATQELFDLP